MKYTYGIDFGTTNSTISIVKNGKVENLQIDPEAINPSIMRSVIYVSPEMKFLFGKPAVDAYLVDVAQGKGAIKKTIFTGRMIKIASPADAMGFRKDQIVPEILDIEESSGGRLFQALKSALSKPSISMINIFGQTFTLEELIGTFLKEMKERADAQMGESINSVVIGRPVQYVGDNNELAVERMTTALQYAGFTDITFEFEPIGAALDYGLSVKDQQIALIFDFGGGTLDLSIVKFPEGEVLVNTGLAIGGDYFNSKIFKKRIAKYFGSETKYGTQQIDLPSSIFLALQNWYQISLLKGEDFNESIESFRYMSSNIESVYALKSLVNNNLGFGLYEEIEKTKKELSFNNEAIYSFTAPDIDIHETVERTSFEEIISQDLINIENLMRDSVMEAGISIENVDVIATTGGSSLIPSVKTLITKTFGENKIKESDAFTSVASGLALRAMKTD